MIESSGMIDQEEKMIRWIGGRATWEECRANLLTEPWPHCQCIADQLMIALFFMTVRFMLRFGKGWTAKLASQDSYSWEIISM